MPERINRRDKMVEEATRLFIENGYAKTSVREIAEAVGCTEAALYYHFKDGKRALLRAVVECGLPDMFRVLEDSDAAPTLESFIHQFGKSLIESNFGSRSRVRRMRWLMHDFPVMSPEEQALVQGKNRQFYLKVAEIVERYVTDSVQAHHIAATLLCAAFGYGFLYWGLDLDTVIDFKPEDLINQLATHFSEER